jgi:hypothetical protein
MIIELCDERPNHVHNLVDHAWESEPHKRQYSAVIPERLQHTDTIVCDVRVLVSVIAVDEGLERSEVLRTTCLVYGDPSHAYQNSATKNWLV